MKTTKRVISTILVVAMCLTMAPLSGFMEIKWEGSDFPEFDFSETFTPKARAYYYTYSDGYYTYSVSGGKATITDVGTSISGDITIPSTLGGYPVTSIGEDAFYGCRSLTSVTIGNSVTSIGEYAFYNCSSLTSVSIPDSVTSIGEDAFAYCDALTSVYITDLEKWFNISFGDDYSNPLYYTADLYINNELATEITIPSSVTSIGTQLRGCTSIKSVIIPDSVTTIESYAFRGCSALTSVTIPDSVTYIDYSAFSGCSSLTSVTIPDSVTYIGYYAFYGCKALTSVTIPDSVTSIGNYALAYCSSLTSVTIPDSVTYIGDYAFQFCSALTSVTIPDSVTSIGEDAFKNCSVLSSVTIGNSVTSIHEGAFEDCSALKCVLYNGTKEDWNNISVDSYNSSLTSAKRYYLVEGTYYNDGSVIFNQNATMALYHHGADRVYKLPDGTRSLEQRSFEDSHGLYAILLPEGLKNIGSYAFYHREGSYSYTSASNLHVIYIPATVTAIDQYAFDYCDYITDVYYGGTKEQWNAIQIGTGNSDLTSAEIHFGTKLIEADGVIYTEDMATLVAFSDKKSGTFTVPATVKTIASKAFCNCDKLTEVILPDGLITIGDNSFYDCDKLKNIVIPDTVTSIGASAFHNCDALASVTIGNSVTSIGSSAFEDCNALTSVTIPDSVTSIGNSAFESCSSLSQVVLPGALTSLGSSAFKNCSKLTSINIPSSLTSIPASIFSGCRSLSGITIPGSITSIGNSAFSYCKALATVSLPESILTIGEYAFSGCEALTYVSLPDSVKTLGEYVFYNCKNLADICLPEGELSAIPGNAFNACSNLTNIYIPDNITSFGDSAFFGCNNLSDIYYNGTETEWNAISIVSSNSVIWAADVHFAHSHETPEWKVLYEAQPHSNGIKSSLCEICLYEERVTIPATHTTVTVEATNPTCKTVGYTEGIYCNDCQKYVSGHTEIAVDTNAHKWDNGTVTTPATCKVNGVKTYTCQNNAAHKKTENLGVNTSNHVNTKNVAEVKATCTTKGTTAGVYCNDCQKYVSGHTETAVDANAHKWDNGTITTTATCKVNGEKVYTCQNNASHKKTENLGVNASNHVNTRNVAEVKATCTAKGTTAGVYCNDCQKYISGHAEIAINPANHVNTKNVPETPATFETVGYTAGVYCNDCKKYISGHTEIPRLVPVFTDSKDAKVNGNDILSNNGLTAAQLLSQAGKGAVIRTSDGKAVENTSLIGTGMILTMADGSKKEIVVYGDVDGNGKITAADARKALRASVSLEKYKETSAQYKAANVESKNKISASDARLILRASVGLEDAKKWMK